MKTTSPGSCWPLRYLPVLANAAAAFPMTVPGCNRIYRPRRSRSTFTITPGDLWIGRIVTALQPGDITLSPADALAL